MPPAAAAVAGGGAALGLLGGGLAAATGAGKTKYQADNFSQTHDYDPNKFNYGGYAGGARDAANAYGGKSSEYGGQQETLYNRGSNELDLGNEARGGQGVAANAMLGRAMGNDLVSTKMADAERRGLIAEGQSGVASARGPAALALAQQQNQAATAQGLAGVGANEQINSANEKLANLQGAFGAFSGMRTGDIGSANTAFGAGANSGQLGLGYSGLQNKVNEDQLQAGETNQQILAQSHGQEQNTNAQIATNNAGQDLNYLKMGLGGAQGGMQSGAALATNPGGGGSVPKPAAHGGPVDGGGPYLVGEKGPELILPKDDGFVLTAPQTRFVLSTATPQQKATIDHRDAAHAMGGPIHGAYADGGLLGMPITAGADPGNTNPTGTSVLGSGGGMDVMGSLAANNAAAMQYANQPGFAREEGGVVHGLRALAHRLGVKFDQAHDAAYETAMDAAGSILPDPADRAPSHERGQPPSPRYGAFAREEGGPVAAAKHAGHFLLAIPSAVAQAAHQLVTPAPIVAPTPAPIPYVPSPRPEVMYVERKPPAPVAKEVKVLPPPPVMTTDEREAEMARIATAGARASGGAVSGCSHDEIHRRLMALGASLGRK